MDSLRWSLRGEIVPLFRILFQYSFMKSYCIERIEISGHKVQQFWYESKKENLLHISSDMFRSLKACQIKNSEFVKIWLFFDILSQHLYNVRKVLLFLVEVRLAEWSKAPDLSSGSRLWAWVRTPHLTKVIFSSQPENQCRSFFLLTHFSILIASKIGSGLRLTFET